MTIDIEVTVTERYSEGARERQESLCCPVDYDSGLLAMLPQEIIERDYGCGDPSRYVQPGDVVLDLGSGGGKICYMAAQLTGAAGHVIGVDMNDDMLALARKYQAEMAGRLGGDRVRFVKGYIQDLALDIDALGQYLADNPVREHADYSALKAWEQQQRRQAPLIPDASVDLVISNCVLNLVADSEKQQLVQEIFRVLRPGGRIAISDIVSDRAIPETMKQDPDLWSGCISGAFEESEFANAFAAAGFSGVCYDKRDPQPWQVIGDITFRSVTLTAVKPVISKEDSDSHTLMYRGPFAAVIDENGRRFVRGSHEKVTAGTRQLLLSAAFGDAFIDLSHDMATGTAGSCCDTARSVNLAEPEGQAASHGGCCA
jgi:ubiquinone/menaquinone biosynthesis C-methylase UbiE